MTNGQASFLGSCVLLAGGSLSLAVAEGAGRSNSAQVIGPILLAFGAMILLALVLAAIGRRAASTRDGGEPARSAWTGRLWDEDEKRPS